MNVYINVATTSHNKVKKNQFSGYCVLLKIITGLILESEFVPFLTIARTNTRSRVPFQ